MCCGKPKVAGCMKRIQGFLVRVDGEPVESRLSSWHRVWDHSAGTVRDAVLEHGQSKVVEVFDESGSLLIARFSATNEELDQRNSEATCGEILWETTTIGAVALASSKRMHRDGSASLGAHGEQTAVEERLEPTAEPEVVLYANLNTSDVHWAWIDGAQREVPMKLSYLQRGAAKNPNGWLAFGYGLLGEFRDMFRRH